MVLRASSRARVKPTRGVKLFQTNTPLAGDVLMAGSRSAKPATAGTDAASSDDT